MCCSRVCLCLCARVFACVRVYMCLHTLIQEGGCESTICYALFDYKPVPITAAVSPILDVYPHMFGCIFCSIALQYVSCNRHVATCLCKMYCQTCEKESAALHM